MPEEVASSDSDPGAPILSSLQTALSRAGRDSYSLFEDIGIKLLAAHLEDDGKRLEPQVLFSGSRLDAVAPDGIAGLPGPTIVEFRLLSRPRRERIQETLDRLIRLARLGSFPSVLLVIGGAVSDVERRYVVESMNTGTRAVRVMVWGWDDLVPLLKKYAQFISGLVPELAETAVTNVVTQSLASKADDWQSARSRYVDQLKAAYRNNDLVLLLGAGVSASAGMPSWDTLLSKLLIAMIGKRLPGDIGVTDSEKREVARNLQLLQAPSALLEARYIRNGLGGDFAVAISDALYGSIAEAGCGTSALLDALGRLCVPRRSGPGIRAIVTYNFDDLLERHLNTLGVAARPIYRDGDHSSRDELGIFHVHGFLPREPLQYDGLSESLLVFSEEGYHELYTDAYSWSNIVQLNLLREGICLLVGLSVTDPNLRRLLDIAARKNKTARHYVILKRVLADELLESGSQESSKEIRAEAVHAFLSAHHLLQEASFKELGLNVLWVQNYSEIPEVLLAIRA